MFSIWFSSFCQSGNSQAITKSILNLQHLMKPISLSAQRLLTSPSKVMNSKWQHPYLQTKDNPTSQLSEALMGQQRGWQRGCSGDSVTTGKTHKRIGSPSQPPGPCQDTPRASLLHLGSTAMSWAQPSRSFFRYIQIEITLLWLTNLVSWGQSGLLNCQTVLSSRGYWQIKWPSKLPVKEPSRSSNIGGRY